MTAGLPLFALTTLTKSVSIPLEFPVGMSEADAAIQKKI